MIKLFLLFLSVLSFNVIVAQDKSGTITIRKEKEADEGIIFSVVEDMPQYPGGNAELNKFLSDNFNFNYPDSAKNNRIAGTVYIGFTVNENGSISDVKIHRGIGWGCDEEALSNMPIWVLGKQRGRPVKVAMAIPVKFSLN